MTSLVKDLSDGVRLIQLMVRIEIQICMHLTIPTGDYGCVTCHIYAGCLSMFAGDVSLGRYNKNPRMRVQKAENVNKALEFITSRGVKLTNIGPEGRSSTHTIPSLANEPLQISSMGISSSSWA